MLKLLKICLRPTLTTQISLRAPPPPPWKIFLDLHLYVDVYFLFTGIKDGMFSVLFMSPESVRSKLLRDIFLSGSMQKRVCLLAGDEAHCISEWY